jgi:Flp pilus assembly pilin Flp
MLTTWVIVDDWVRHVRTRVMDKLVGEDGQGMTEYVLILALVAVALFGVINFTGLGTSLSSAVTRIVTKVDAQS